MKAIGLALIFLALGSFALHYFNMEFKLLMWVDMWGQEIGWAIRGGMVALGAVLFLVGAKREAQG